MGEAAAALNVGPEFEFETLMWRLTPPDFESFARFELWLEGQAWGAVRRARRHMSPEEYDRRMDGVAEKVAAGVYSMGQPAFQRALAGYKGMRELVRLMLLPKHPQADTELADRMLKHEPTAELIGRMVEGMFPKPAKKKKGKKAPPMSPSQDPASPPSALPSATSPSA